MGNNRLFVGDLQSNVVLLRIVKNDKYKNRFAIKTVGYFNKLSEYWSQSRKKSILAKKLVSV